MLGVSASCAAVAAVAMLVPQGQVITLNTFDSKGHSHPTQLWIVELDGVSYVQAGTPDTEWLARMRARPGVTLDGSRLGDVPTPYVATPIDDDPAAQVRVAEAMTLKYGLADRLWSWLFDRTHSIPIRLDPRAVEPSP